VPRTTHMHSLLQNPISKCGVGGKLALLWESEETDILLWQTVDFLNVNPCGTQVNYWAS